MSQSLAKLYIHAIFSTKHREPILASEWREELFGVMGKITNNVECHSFLIGGVADHVHMLFGLGRTISISEAIGKIKSNSSVWINQTRGLKSHFNWQQGYGAFSVSQSSVEDVRAYILRQEAHHANQTFQDEMRLWFRRYEIEFDEKYVWE